MVTKEQIEELTEDQRALLSLWLTRRSRSPYENNGERKRLHAYVTSHGSTPAPSNDTLRSGLKESLPDFMIPDVISVLSEFPRLPNGKVNQRALPDATPSVAPAETKAGDAPKDETERILTEIWSDLLSVKNLGTHDNFFEFGGDSIVSIQVVSRAREAGLTIEPWHLADHPTIAELAAVVSPVVDQSTPPDDTESTQQTTAFADSGLDQTELDDFLDGLD